MIEALAERLGMETEALVSAILDAAGERPQMTLANERVRVSTGEMLGWHSTGRVLIIATGLDDDFESVPEYEHAEPVVSGVLTVYRPSTIKAMTIRMRS